jgi:hypothetical protein
MTKLIRIWYALGLAAQNVQRQFLSFAYIPWLLIRIVPGTTGPPLSLTVSCTMPFVHVKFPRRERTLVLNVADDTAVGRIVGRAVGSADGFAEGGIDGTEVGGGADGEAVGSDVGSIVGDDVGVGVRGSGSNNPSNTAVRALVHVPVRRR